LGDKSVQFLLPLSGFKEDKIELEGIGVLKTWVYDELNICAIIKDDSYG